MNAIRNNRFQFLVALFALFLFSGDLVADAVRDMAGVCMSEAAHHAGDDEGCPCSTCAVHSGSAIPFSGIVLVDLVPVDGAVVRVRDEHAPVGEPVPIEHPPQLG